MILYFSGTGNSEYVAKRIGKAIGDDVVNLFEKIKTQDIGAMKSEMPWVVVTPTYAWRIPHIVQDWMKRVSFSGNKQIYFVMTCGGDIGNAGKYLKTLCEELSLTYCGCAGILMPENYIALFSTPTDNEAEAIIAKAESTINRTIASIRQQKPIPDPRITLKDKLNSGIVNDIFYPIFVHAKKFYATDECISCGKCANVCPLSNIKIESGKPVWGSHCTHCMACICRCPKEAIEYGKHSKGLPRYVCKKTI